MGTTFIEDELLKRSSSGILTPMRSGDVIQSSQLAMTTSSDPAGDAAVTTAIIDEFGGVIITLTGAGNAQTLQSPTSSTAGKSFTVVSDNGNGANTIEVGGITLSAGEAQKFIWDGSAWVAVTAVDADDITLTPTGDIVATDVQAGIAELDTEKMLRITSVDNEIARFDSTGGDVQGYSSNAPTISDSGVTELKALLKLTGADADILSLGDATHEGGDLKIYRDGSGNLQLSLDADAASNALALSVYGGVVAQNYLTVGQTSLNTSYPFYVNGSFRANGSGIFGAMETSYIRQYGTGNITLYNSIEGSSVFLKVFGTHTCIELDYSAAPRIGLYGVTPTTQAAHIADPAENAAANNAAIDAILVALENVGILAST